MLEFDSIAPSDLEDSSAPAKRGRRRAILAAPKSAPKSPEILSLPRWARLADVGEAQAAFSAGAGLALFDRILRTGEGGSEPVFSGALRQRLALKAAASCARLARLREDAGALRDAEHLSPPGAPPSPAGRPHRLFRLFSTRPLRLDAETLGLAAELLEFRTAESTVVGVTAACQEILARAGSPLLAAAGVSRAAMTVLAEAAPVDAEILSLWLADLTLAQKLGWQGPVPLLASVIAEPALRRNGRRPRPSDPDWAQAVACAYAWRPATRTPWPPIFQGAQRGCWRSNPNCARKARIASSRCCSTTIASRRRARRNSRGSPIARAAACSIG